MRSMPYRIPILPPTVLNWALRGLGRGIRSGRHVAVALRWRCRSRPAAVSEGRVVAEGRFVAGRGIPRAVDVLAVLGAARVVVRRSCFVLSLIVPFVVPEGLARRLSVWIARVAQAVRRSRHRGPGIARNADVFVRRRPVEKPVPLNAGI